MMHICQNCSQMFSDDEVETIRECVGEFWGTPAYQNIGVCPYCKSDDWQEAEQCKGCGEYFIEHDLTDDMCTSCYADNFSSNRTEE